jgi:hypothetical protein
MIYSVVLVPRKQLVHVSHDDLRFEFSFDLPSVIWALASMHPKVRGKHLRAWAHIFQVTTLPGPGVDIIDTFSFFPCPVGFNSIGVK